MFQNSGVLTHATCHSSISNATTGGFSNTKTRGALHDELRVRGPVAVATSREANDHGKSKEPVLVVGAGGAAAAARFQPAYLRRLASIASEAFASVPAGHNGTERSPVERPFVVWSLEGLVKLLLVKTILQRVIIPTCGSGDRISLPFLAE